MSLIAHYFPTLTPEQLERFAALDALYHDWNAKINVISRKDIDNLYEHHVLHSLGIAEVINFRPGTRVMDLGTGGGFPGIPLAIMFPDVQFHLVDSIGKKIRVCNEVIAALGLTNVTTQHARAEDVRYAPNPKKLKKHSTPAPSAMIQHGTPAPSSMIQCGTPAPSSMIQHGTPAPSASPAAMAGGDSVAVSPSFLLQPARFDFVVSRAVMPLADLVKIAQPHIAQNPNAANALPNGLIALKGGELEHEAAAVRREKLITPLSDYFTEEYFETKKVVYVQLS